MVGFGSQLSCAVTVKVTTAEQKPAAVLLVMAAGQVMLGPVVSLTVTVALQLSCALWLSVTYSVTECAPVPDSVVEETTEEESNDKVMVSPESGSFEPLSTSLTLTVAMQSASADTV